MVAKVITVKFSINKTNKYLKLTLHAMPSMANLLSLTETKISGIKTGKLKIAIKLILFDAFEAIALIKLNTPENAVELNNKHNEYIPKS